MRLSEALRFMRKFRSVGNPVGDQCDRYAWRPSYSARRHTSEAPTRMYATEKGYYEKTIDTRTGEVLWVYRNT